jgi:hypothetical protein
VIPKLRALRSFFLGHLYVADDTPSYPKKKLPERELLN